MKSLKHSEAVNRRRTDNTMGKRKRARGQTTINKTLHGKLMIEQHESGVNSGAQEWQQLFSTCYTIVLLLNDII
jgi:hypothetical protein